MSIDLSKKVAIVGAGGFGREVLCCLIDALQVAPEAIADYADFFVEDKYLTVSELMGVPVLPLSQFHPQTHQALIAIGDPSIRQQMVEKLPKETQYPVLIHPTAVLSKWVSIGEGSIITAGCILTCNIKLGKHIHLNLHSTVGHDCEIGDFFTASPGVNISGNCHIGQRVYLGTNAALREKVEICDDAVIGMGAIVVKNIHTAGVYVGNPAKMLGS